MQGWIIRLVTKNLAIYYLFLIFLTNLPQNSPYLIFLPDGVILVAEVFATNTIEVLAYMTFLALYCSHRD